MNKQPSIYVFVVFLIILFSRDSKYQYYGFLKCQFFRIFSISFHIFFSLCSTEATATLRCFLTFYLFLSRSLKNFNQNGLRSQSLTRKPKGSKWILLLPQIYRLHPWESLNLLIISTKIDFFVRFFLLS